ncbi:stress response translation initiation inhibitor YciH [Aliidiomarina taiwanensis]|uniref:Stress response translation initiation inhibitor YciH n=1 Tax=Aliidiomarina taiwanensis TaxID=946228 RepID=A0A432X1S9_9GAMM|nr:stress response translation initiation inhibitor YciH [Aliidiomarina taiwanensis]RUO40510.1 stress response translation initiation inhibitor YciH [Aliidiomarina taiwanensis]
MSLKDQLSQLVYSTEQGKITPEEAPEQVPQGDGIVRIRRETKGRKGRGVTVIEGLGVTQAELKDIAKQLKKRCGVGGSTKEYAIEIQGDQREACAEWLRSKGYTVRFSGG